MHIPNSMLNGQICPVTAVLSALGVIWAIFMASKSDKKPTAARFGAITALIFAGQMMNFPISNGTSGHLLGGVMAAVLLGLPFGVLAMSLVVTIQCLVFSDGGVSVLGANILNMAILGTVIGGFVNQYLLKSLSVSSSKRNLSMGFAAWVSVMIAALACSIELALSGTIPFSKVIVAMLGTHAVIGVGEGLITVAVCSVLGMEPIRTSQKKSVAIPLIASGIIAIMLSPFASGFPDGLEWIAGKYHFLNENAPTFVTPLSDYSVSFMKNEVLSTSLAGVLGVAISFMVAFVFMRIVGRKTQTIKA